MSSVTSRVSAVTDNSSEDETRAMRQTVRPRVFGHPLSASAEESEGLADHDRTLSALEAEKLNWRARNRHGRADSEPTLSDSYGDCSDNDDDAEGQGARASANPASVSIQVPQPKEPPTWQTKHSRASSDPNRNGVGDGEVKLGEPSLEPARRGSPSLHTYLAEQLPVVASNPDLTAYKKTRAATDQVEPQKYFGHREAPPSPSKEYHPSSVGGIARIKTVPRLSAESKVSVESPKHQQKSVWDRAALKATFHPSGSAGGFFDSSAPNEQRDPSAVIKSQVIGATKTNHSGDSSSSHIRLRRIAKSTPEELSPMAEPGDEKSPKHTPPQLALPPMILKAEVKKQHDEEKKIKKAAAAPTVGRWLKDAVVGTTFKLRKKSKTPRRRDVRDDANPLHMIHWDQRATVPGRDAAHLCSCCTAPNFWMRVEWVIRSSFLGILPAAALAYAPATREWFHRPSLLPEMAFWIASPTLGDGFKSFAQVVKAYIITIPIMCIMIGSQVNNKWLWLGLFSLFIFLAGAFTDSARRTCALIICVAMMDYQAGSSGRTWEFMGNYFRDLTIGLAIGLFALIFPKPTWSLSIAQSHCSNLGNVCAVAMQGFIHSMWSPPLERELHLVKLQQLRSTMASAIVLIDKRVAESEYEPHTGLAIAKVRYLRNFLADLVHIVRAAVDAIVVINDNPAMLDSPSAKLYGDLIADALASYGSAMDITLLKIGDEELIVDADDIRRFQDAKDTFEATLLNVRETVLSSTESDPSEADVAIGYFFFSLQQAGSAILSYDPPTKAPSHFLDFVLSPWRDIKGSARGFRDNLVGNCKIGFKLSLAITISAALGILIHTEQPVSGTAIIASVSSTNQADTFRYSSSRMLGTVVGSVIGYVLAQLANGDWLGILGGLAVLVLIGSFIQSSRTNGPAGSSIVFSALHILRPGSGNGSTLALSRIQQNVFAIMIYFVVASVIWPTRANESIRSAMMDSLRGLRKSVGGLMEGLGERDTEVCEEIFKDVGDLLKDWRKKMADQENLIDSAVVEPTMTGSDFPEQAFRLVLTTEENLHTLVTMISHACKTFLMSKSEDSLHWKLLRRIEDKCNDYSDVVYAVIDLHLLSMTKTPVPVAHLVKLRVTLLELSKEIVDIFTTSLDKEMKMLLNPSNNNSFTSPKDHEPFSTARSKRSGTTIEVTTPSPDAKHPASSLTAMAVTEHAKRSPVRQASIEDVSAMDVEMSQLSRSINKDAADVGSDDLVDEKQSHSVADSEASVGTAELVLSNEDIHSLEAWVFGIQAITAELGILQKALLMMQHFEELDEVF